METTTGWAWEVFNLNGVVKKGLMKYFVKAYKKRG